MYTCKSVINGWQTCLQETGETFGPAFNDIRDLWNWQRANLAGWELEGLIIIGA